MSNLDSEILQWVQFAKAEEALEKDFFGHLFHGNQHTDAEGAGSSAPSNRYQVSGRFQPLASRAQELAKNPTAQGHRELSAQHTEQAKALRELAATAKPEQAKMLENAARAHEVAALTHMNTAQAHENRITAGKYANEVSEGAVNGSQMADERTATALAG